HGERRLVGLLPPRRRCRHRLLAPRRPGLGRRRHPGGGEETQPRPHQRPRTRRRPPCRCRLRGGGRDGAREGFEDSFARGGRRMSAPYTYATVSRPTPWLWMSLVTCGVTLLTLVVFGAVGGLMLLVVLNG